MPRLPMRVTSYFAIFLASSWRGASVESAAGESWSPSVTGACAQRAGTRMAMTQRILRSVLSCIAARAKEKRMGPPHLEEGSILQRVEQFWGLKKLPDALNCRGFWRGRVLEPFQEGIGVGHAWEKFFLFLKLHGVDAT